MLYHLLPAARSHRAPLLTLAALLALGGCHASEPAGNTADSEITANDAVALEGNADDGQTQPESTATPVTVAALPPVAAAVPAAQAQPIADAATIEADIQRGTDISRVRHGDGWAWMRGDEIIRTASRDGKEVAYFRHGAPTPFVAQHDGRTFAYSGDAVTHEFGADGRPRAPDATGTREARALAQRATHDRNDARAVEQAHPEGPAAHDDGHPSPATHDTGKAGHDAPARTDDTKPHARRDGQDRSDRGAKDADARPAAAPTPAPTDAKAGGRKSDGGRPSD